MKLVVGLGNPGKRYLNNRHNVGYMVIDEIKKLRLESKNFILEKAGVYMNNSGAAVKKLVENYRVETGDLILVHDDLDIPLGQYKLQFGRGPKDHRGVNSVIAALGTGNFWRVRVGIDRRDPASRTRGEDYVLEDFTPAERLVIEGLVKEICRGLAIS